MSKASSIKQLIQQMSPEKIRIIEGVVVKTDPLSIQVVNNPKMVVTGLNLILPKHLTDYQSMCTIALCESPILTGETSMENEHSHSNPEGGSTGLQSAHKHLLNKFALTEATITVHNSLKINQRVYMLRFDGGKLYYVLDRVVS